ncbi:PREDICTED: basic proline-rich protein-like [Capra hircus]|uniref:basic proline-rich protein-like n=1 Tax=Capra hircus TaxID=9925 RepID=UPI00084710C7|nr:PREDICTED: basic proline-rich protein-like [Capra hircus]
MERELSPERLPFRRMVAARADNLTALSRALRGIVGLLGPQPLGIASSAPPKVDAVREARPVFQETWRERAGPEPTHIALSPGSLAGLQQPGPRRLRTKPPRHPATPPPRHPATPPPRHPATPPPATPPPRHPATPPAAPPLCACALGRPAPAATLRLRTGLTRGTRGRGRSTRVHCPRTRGVEATLTPVGQDRGEAASEACELPEDRHSPLRVGRRALKGKRRVPPAPGCGCLCAPPPPGTVPFAPGDGADRRPPGRRPGARQLPSLGGSAWRWPQGHWYPGLR